MEEKKRAQIEKEEQLEMAIEKKVRAKILLEKESKERLIEPDELLTQADINPFGEYANYF